MYVNSSDLLQRFESHSQHERKEKSSSPPEWSKEKSVGYENCLVFLILSLSRKVRDISSFLFFPFKSLLFDGGHIPLKMLTRSSWHVNLKANAAWCDSRTLRSLYKMASSFPELQRNPLYSCEKYRKNGENRIKKTKSDDELSEMSKHSFLPFLYQKYNHHLNWKLPLSIDGKGCKRKKERERNRQHWRNRPYKSQLRHT